MQRTRGWEGTGCRWRYAATPSASRGLLVVLWLLLERLASISMTRLWGFLSSSSQVTGAGKWRTWPALKGQAEAVG
jgi:hypothetical protein